MGSLKLVKKDFLSREMRHLPLQDVEARLSRYKSIIRQELRDKGLAFDFHLWVSDEWFCPDGVPGFALPFYLFHPELMEIQKDQLGFVDGKNEEEILKLMRHELGHAIDNAYGLRAHAKRQRVFGSPKRDYPSQYQPRPYSKNFVHYLGDHYAQSHPDEDFAETFAYWLDPNKNIRFKKDSPRVEEKFQLMDTLIREIRHKRPKLKNSFRIEPIEKNRTVLATHYRQLKSERRHTAVRRLDHDLKSTFFMNSKRQACYSLARFLKKKKKQHSEQISRREGVYKYEAAWGLEKIIDRAEKLNIEAPLPELEKKTDSLLKRNFRYLKNEDQLKIYL